MKHLLYSLAVVGGLAALTSATAQSAQFGKTDYAISPKQQDAAALVQAIKLKMTNNGHGQVADAMRGAGPDNDDCSNAEVLAVGTTCLTTAGTLDGATESIVGGDSCGVYTYDIVNDVWYAFVATTTTTIIEVTGGGTATDGIDAVIIAYEGDCAALSVLDCADNTVRAGTEAITLPTTVGTTYTYRVFYYMYTAPQTIFDFTTCVREPSDVPTNDDCANAQVVQVEDMCIGIPGTTDAATESMLADSCAGFISPSALDVWYYFEATSTSTTVQATGGAGFDGVLMVYDGTCGAFAIIGCADATVGGGIESAVITTFVGDTYYYRVYAYGAASGQTAFDFTTCVFNTPAAPANDLCEDVTASDLAIDATVTFMGNNVGAQNTEGLGNPSVWEAFTITECADVIVSYCGTTPAFANGFTSLYTSCPIGDFISAVSFNADSCGDGNFSLYYEGLAPGTYYYGVMLDTDVASLAQGDYLLNVSASACALPPAGDDCAGAVMLTSASTCNNIPGTTTGATQTMVPILCNGFTSSNANDVFYSFIATSAEHTITVTGIGDFDGVIEFFTGDCSGLVPAGCTDDTFPQGDGVPVNEVMIQSGLIIGNTYYFRLYDYAHASPNHAFEICVTGSGPGGIGDLAVGNELSLFPNPGTGMITLRASTMEGAATIEVLDVTGRVVYTENTRLNVATAHSMDLTALVAGNYNVRVTANDVRTTQRMVIK